MLTSSVRSRSKKIIIHIFSILNFDIISLFESLLFNPAQPETAYMAITSEKNANGVHSPAGESPVAEKFSESENDDVVLSANLDTLPKGYFTSASFLGTMAASGFAIAGV